MDRAIVYDAEVPQTTDILRTNKVAHVGLSFASRAIVGDGPAIHGFACTQTQPNPSLNVLVGPGSIYTLGTLDATAYGDMGTDGATVEIQGISYLTQTFATPAPGTGGFSINYLIEIGLTQVDGNSQAVPFYNGGNAPTTTTKNTARLMQATVQIKAGTAAATGTQTTPTADSGFTGVWVVTVANGQTTVTASNIVLVTAAIKDAIAFPNLPGIPPDMQQSVWTYFNDTGAVNALSVTPYPPITALTTGMGLFVKVGTANTGAATLAVVSYSGTITKSIKRNNGNALSSGDLALGGIYLLVYDGTNWQTVNFFGTLVSTQTNNFTANQSYGVDHGPPNHIIISPTPMVKSMPAGLVLIADVANNNTGATDLVVNQQAAVPVIEHGQALDPYGVEVNRIIHTVFDGTSLHKVPKRRKIFTFDISAPPASPYAMAIGDQVNVTFTNATSVPLSVNCSGATNGCYSIEMVVSVNSSLFTLVQFLPNDTGVSAPSALNWWFTGAFDDPFGVDPFDLYSWPAALTLNSNYIPTRAGSQTRASGAGSHPAPTGPNAYLGFVMRTFAGIGDLDDEWGVGPFMMRLDVSTITAAKFLKFQSGVFGGPAAGFNNWADTTTAWNSLGTLQVSGTNPSSSSFGALATISGTVIIRRNA